MTNLSNGLLKMYKNEIQIFGPQQFKGNFDLIEKNVYGCFEFHYKLAEQFGLVNAFGIFKIRVHDPSTTTEKSVGVKRRIHFFCIDHVNMPTYSKSYELSECSEVDAEVILDVPIDFSKSKARTFLESKLAEMDLKPSKLSC